MAVSNYKNDLRERQNTLSSLLKKYNLSLSLWIFWGLLCFTPWQQWLNVMPWFRTGLAISLFVFPGTLASLLLARKQLSLFFHTICGFVFSVFFTAILGSLGRILHFSFTDLKALFLFLGFLLILTVAVHQRRFPKEKLYREERADLQVVFTLVLLMVLGIIINLSSTTTGDDQSYLAYLTTWERSPALNFSEVYFGSGALDSKRFWLAIFPMSLALIANFANLPGILLIGLYLEPFMICLAILAAYLMYKAFLSSNSMTMSALFLHFTFLFLLRGYQQIGTTFFNRLSEDKAVAAFILTPIFLWATHHLIKKPTWRRCLFFTLCGCSLTFTHPVILAFSLFIALGYAGLTFLLQKKKPKRLTTLLLLSVIIVAPGGALRLINDPSTPISYDLDQALEDGAGIETRINFIPDTPFYGFQLERIQISTLSFPIKGDIFQTALSLSYLWLLGLIFFWAIFHVRKNSGARLLLASSTLVLLALIPYTGWLIGYVVSARMLWRIPWVFPIGLGCLLLLKEPIHASVKIIKAHGLRLRHLQENMFFFSTLAIFIGVVSYLAIFTRQGEWTNLLRKHEYQINLKRLASLGDYLEKHVEKPARFITPGELKTPMYGLFSQDIMDYLPGLSSKSKSVYFRYWKSLTSTEQAETDLLFITNGSVNFQQKKGIMLKYQIDFILTDDPQLYEHFFSRPELFSIKETAGFWIIQLR